MASFPRTTLERLIAAAAAVLVLRVTAAVLTNYPGYLPPDFSTEFLHGREDRFWGPYHWAFYAHLATGPIVLVLGLVLLSDPIRRRSPKWHRRLGWVQVGLVLFGVAPSGLAMSFDAATGPVGGVGFGTLAVATATCAAVGVKAAAQRRFSAHRRWMIRCSLLLGSAVTLRVMGGLAVVLGVAAPWYDALASWLCWVVPLAVFEVLDRRRR